MGRVSPQKIIHVIARHFHENSIRSACLASSIFSKMLIEKYSGLSPTLIKGYVVMEDKCWGHFWLQVGEDILDPGSLIFFLDLPQNLKSVYQRRSIVEKKPQNKKCIDSIGFEKIRDESYIACMNGQFWEDLQKNTDETSTCFFMDLYDDIEDEIRRNVYNQ